MPEYYIDDKRHLICVPYSVEELHKMAEALNINRCWYHAGRYPHYDVPKKRIVELQEKCILVDQRFLFRLIKQYIQ